MEKRDERNVPFYQTNPPFLQMFFYVSSVSSDTYVVCRVGLQVGSFWKTNPPGGGIAADDSGVSSDSALVGFGCRDNYFAASRRTRFGKRTHREGYFGGVCPLPMAFWPVLVPRTTATGPFVLQFEGDTATERRGYKAREVRYLNPNDSVAASHW